MSQFVEFTVPGQPVGKGRARVGRINGKPRMFTPEKTVSYEGLVAWTAQAAMAGRTLLEGAVTVEMFIGCQVPASWSKKKQAEALAGTVYPTTKPDIDNVEKAIFDAMNGVVWKDDVQVCSVVKGKAYAASPRVEVRVFPMGAIA